MTEFKKFKVSDIFEKAPFTKLKIRAKTLPKTKSKTNDVPLIAAGIENQGTVGYINHEKIHPLKNMITVSANGTNSGATFYQKRKFSILQDAYPLRPLNTFTDSFNDQVNLYMVAILKNRLKDNNYNNKATWNRIKNYDIELPVTPSGDPDFAYMTRYIQDLEAQRIQDLDAYLKVSGQDNTELTDQEKAALTKKVEWKKFRIGDLFSEPGKGDVDLHNSDINGRGYYFINSGSTNLGIKGKTTREAKIFPANTITIDFFGNAYYRDFEYKLATHNHVFSFDDPIIKNKEVGLYLVSAFSYLKKVFAYNNMLTWKKLQDMYLTLPVTSTGAIDFTYMQDYITALEKLNIKDVMAYKDKVITATKQIVRQQSWFAFLSNISLKRYTVGRSCQSHQ